MQPFALIRPEQLVRARELVAQKPDSHALRAGGVDLIDRMKEGIDEPSLLVELRAIPELDASDPATAIAEVEGPKSAVEGDAAPAGPPMIHVRALTTLAMLGAAEIPGAEALTEAASQAATPSIRNSATVGGNLLQRPRCWYFRRQELLCLKKGGDTCLALTGDNRYHAILGAGPSFIVHPSSLATALTALDASVSVYRGESGDPRAMQPGAFMPLDKLFVAPSEDPAREHRLEPGDVLTGVYLPKLEGMRSAYQAVREKRSHDWPLVEAAARMRLEGGVMKDVRVALGHVAPVPWLAPAAAELLEGQKPDAGLFARAADAALAEAKPLDGNRYKVPMSKGLLREVLHRAAGLDLPE